MCAKFPSGCGSIEARLSERFQKSHGARRNDECERVASEPANMGFLLKPADFWVVGQF